MEPAGGSARGHWRTAVGLTLAVLSFRIVDVLPLVALPLAVLLLALPARPQRWKRVGLGLGVGGVSLLLPGGPLGTLSRGWALLLGGGFLLVTLWRPRWGVFSRALLALGVAGGVLLGGLLLSGRAAEVDWRVREHVETQFTQAADELAARAPDAPWAKELRSTTAQMARLRWTLFPAELALQSLASLALVAWLVARLRARTAGVFRLRPVREFRFNDQLVWLLVAALLLLALPLGAPATRVGYNALFFMGALYALRGVGVCVFLAGGAPSPVVIAIGMLAGIVLFPALILLYPPFLAAVLLVGLGDTWLDVRGRAALAPRA